MPPKTPVQPAKSRVLIVDDHPMVRDWLGILIGKQTDLTVCGEAASASEAMQLVAAQKPDIAIVDLSLEGKSGLELIKDLKALHPNLPILVLSMHDESLYAERVLRAGARGYVAKREATDKVMVAIRRILGGDIYVSDSLSAKIVRQAITGGESTAASPLSRLSDRELEVFQFIGRGKSTRQIAEVLNLDVKTIESYRTRVREKLGLESSRELLQHAIQWVQSGGNG